MGYEHQEVSERSYGQGVGCIGAFVSQAQLVKHQPQSYLPEGTRCFPISPFVLRRCRSFLKLSRGFPFMVLHYREFAQKEKHLFNGDA